MDQLHTIKPFIYYLLNLKCICNLYKICNKNTMMSPKYEVLTITSTIYFTQLYYYIAFYIFLQKVINFNVIYTPLRSTNRLFIF